MANKVKAKAKTAEELLQDLIIIQMAKEGVGGHEIRAFLGINYNRVANLVQMINKARGKANAKGK